MRLRYDCFSEIPLKKRVFMEFSAIFPLTRLLSYCFEAELAVRAPIVMAAGAQRLVAFSYCTHLTIVYVWPKETVV